MAAPERDTPEEARQYALALTEILRSSRWYDRVSFHDAAYNWSATRLPLEVIKQYLAAGIADPWVAAECFRDFGISAEQIQAAGVGEQITIGTMSLEDAAKVILGPRAAGGLDQLFEVVRKEAGLLASKDLSGQARVDFRRDKDKEGHRWRDARVDHLAGFLDDQPPVPPELAPWVREQSDDVLLGFRDGAIPWAGPLTIAVARLELERFEQVRRDLGLGPADWEAEVAVEVSGHLHTLVMGCLATRELTRRLGKRVEAAIASPPGYVTAMLGPYPEGELAQLTWTRAVQAIEELRRECRIDDPQHALGAPSGHIPGARRLQFQALNRALTRARIELERGPSSTSAQEPRPAGRLGPYRYWLPDDQVAVDWGGDQLVDLDAMRPDEELTALLYEQIPDAVRPVEYVETAAALTDEDLAGRWAEAVERHLREELWDRSQPRGGSSALRAAVISNELWGRVVERTEVVNADPPSYIVDALGPSPLEGDWRDDWLRHVEQIEGYRLLTGTTDPARPLGPTPEPDNSWQQCWRRELTQELADARRSWMTYQHQTIGRSSERDDLAMVASSALDPWFGVRPSAALVDESHKLPVEELRRRVAAAPPLLVDRPENPTSRLQEVQLRRAELLGYHADEQVALEAAIIRRDEATGRGAKAARQAAQEAVDEHRQALGNLSDRLGDTERELTELRAAQNAYVDWSHQHALVVTQGQAAAQVLHERETQLLADLAEWPPPYLRAELGQPPTHRDGRVAWLRGAHAIECFRADNRITDVDDAFGPPFASEPSEAARVRQFLDDVRQAITDSLARELDRELDGSGQDPPGRPLGE
jgi:hypothetical protein